MSPYRSLIVLMDSNGSLWILLVPYVLFKIKSNLSFLLAVGFDSSLWIIMGPYGSLYALCIFMGAYGSLYFFAFLWILMGCMGPYTVSIDSSLWILMGRYGSFNVLIPPEGF